MFSDSFNYNNTVADLSQVKIIHNINSAVKYVDYDSIHDFVITLTCQDWHCGSKNYLISRKVTVNELVKNSI